LEVSLIGLYGTHVMRIVEFDGLVWPRKRQWNTDLFFVKEHNPELFGASPGYGPDLGKVPGPITGEGVMRLIRGVPVVDAETPVTIHITHADCARGAKKDPTRCAAALALKRATNCDETRVHMACTYLRFGNRWLRYATPPSLKAEIISFDRGGGFYPGDFRLHPMPAVQRLKPAAQKSALKAKRKSKLPHGAPMNEKKLKGEPRVFHRVSGVRERANTSKE
jgi:hypothetical protein